MIPALKNILKNNGLWTASSMGLCAIASLEMGCRSAMNLNALLKANEEDKPAIRADLTANLSGFFLYGIIAPNLFPGLARVGALGLIGHSLFKLITRSSDQEYDQNEYWVGKAITFFPHQTYKAGKWIKSKLTLPQHPSWYILIVVATLVGYWQFGGTIAQQLRRLRDS